MTEVWMPKEYQTFGVKHLLSHEEAGLFYETGLGKTSTTLTAMSELIYETMEVTKALVVAPKNAVETTWPDEIDHWKHLSHMRYSVVVGTEMQRVRALQIPAEVYIVNIEVLPWLVKYYGEYWPYDMLVLDELSKFKDRNTKRWNAVYNIRAYCERVVGLTATPAPESLLDIFPQMYLLDLGQRLGKDFDDFKEDYFAPVYKENRDNVKVIARYVPAPGKEKEIYNKVGDICISVREKDWLKLDPLITRKWSVKLPPEVKEQYDKLERDMFLPLDEVSIHARSAQSVAGKLLQFANGAVYDANHASHEVHTAKLDALEEFVESANGHPVLCFYWYQHDLDRILSRFKQAVRLNGKYEQDAWNRREIPLLLAHPQAHAYSINLQAGSHLLGWFTSPWSNEMYTQGIGRLRRLGQRRQVLSVHFTARGTLDDEVLDRLQDKSRGQNALLEAVKARIRRVKELSM